MPASFYERLGDYFTSVAAVLRGEADAAAIFPNTTDKGIAREHLYVDFLRGHCPSNCNVDLGGFVFDRDGAESRQIDVIITTSNVPRFRLPGSKVFASVLGTIGVVSVKSQLDGDAIDECLDNLDSVPFVSEAQIPKALGGDIDSRLLTDVPLRVVYATSGVSIDTLRERIAEWTAKRAARPNAMTQRLPHVIHVAGSYVLRRELTPSAPGPVLHYERDDGVAADAIALASVIQGLQERAVGMQWILPNFDAVFQRLFQTVRARAAR